MIPYGKQDISEKDIENVVAVLRSDFLTQGPEVSSFEEKFALYCGAEYAVAVNSATSALHIACLAFGLSKGDRLWTVANSFVASANCALYCGAEVDFIDIDAKTFNLSIKDLSEKLERAQSEGNLPKVIVPVHFSGASCDMRAIRELAKRFGFKILEDASHSIGATYEGQKVGSCQFSEMSVFSLHPVKMITAGEGGVVTTNDKELYKKLLKLRTHGITKDPEQLLNQEQKKKSWYFEQQDLGFNYRMTDIHAALGKSQLDRIEEFLSRRRKLASRYEEKLAVLPVLRPVLDLESSWHIYVIRLQLEKIHKSHEEVFNSLREAGIGVNLHYIPIHLHPYYRSLGFKDDYLLETEKYYQEAITLPLYSSLTDGQQDYICQTLREVLTK